MNPTAKAIDPLGVSELISTAYRRYLRSLMPLREPEAARALHEKIDSSPLLSKGPLLEITPPYATGATPRSLVEEGVLEAGFTSPRGPKVSLDRPLYVHQETAIRKAFLEMREDAEPAPALARAITERVRQGDHAFVHIEDVQDMVQEELMRSGYYKVAESYILYRAHRNRQREDQVRPADDEQQDSLVVVVKPNGDSNFWDGADLKRLLQSATQRDRLSSRDSGFAYV